MERKDWALLVIAAAQGASITPAQLQKCLFLLGRERSEQVGDDFYDFQPYDYGPFDALVYRDAEKLAEEDLVVISCPPRRGWSEYAATLKSSERVKQLADNLPAGLGDFIGEKVQWAMSLSFAQLVHAIYQQYPSFAVNGVFRS